MLRLLRQICAVLIVLCLALPESSCTRQNDAVGSGPAHEQTTTEYTYPLKGLDSPAWLALALATFLAPAALSLLRAAPAYSALAVAAGAWFLVRAYLVVTINKPEIGWYLGGLSAAVYTAASLAELCLMLWRRWRRRGPIHPPPLSASG